VQGARGEEVKRGEQGWAWWSWPGAGHVLLGQGGGEAASSGGVLIPVGFE
jgi:hypothetical protein